jgi:cyclophilin family peptidyl-prolyl cis-trans isomerase
MNEEKIIGYLPLVGIILIVILIIFFNINSPQTKDPLQEIITKRIANESGNSSTNTNNNNKSETSSNQIEKERDQNMDGLNNPKLQTPKFKDLIDVNKNYIAEFDTSMGRFKVKLYAKQAPITVTNFVYLTRLGFYDGLIFHRVIKDFMIQGGDPLGTGTGGPAYKFEDEKVEKPLVRGSLAMANAGPNTNGSQFFIVTASETPWLNGKHTNFGEVVEGLEIVQKIGDVRTNTQDRPLEAVTINKITIIEE